jgi:predicted O-methyltransferase YrrM
MSISVPPVSANDLDVIVRANQRLMKELTQLRAEVAAFESSRWWRLHPRGILKRLRSSRVARRIPDEVVVSDVDSPGPDDALIVRFRDDVLARGTFREDWFTIHITNWEPFIRELDERPSRILEIGSFEGLSACYFLWRLSQAQVTCVDTFEGASDYVAFGIAVTDLESLFDSNVSLVDASRVRKLVGDSRWVLLALVEKRRLFDLIYVDGSHLTLDVIVDAALSWQLLAPGGLLIFDDYCGNIHEQDALLRPGPAVDAFLDLVAGHSDLLFKERQVIVRKTD